MDSIVFFLGIGQKFRDKTGIYVFKSPLQYNGQDMYKVGYAYQSLLKRLKDFKTAFGPVHFNIAFMKYQKELLEHLALCGQWAVKSNSIKHERKTLL